MWGPVGWFPLSSHHHATSSLLNPRVARGSMGVIHSECIPAVASRVVNPPHHQAVQGKHIYCLCGETGATQNQQALLLTYSFFLIDVVIFYSPWSVLSCDKQKTDIPCENETILSVGPLPIVPISCGIGSQRSSEHWKKSHYRNAVIIAYKGNMGDVLSYVFTLKFYMVNLTWPENKVLFIFPWILSVTCIAVISMKLSNDFWNGYLEATVHRQQNGRFSVM